MFTSNNHCRKQPAQGTCCLIASSALLTRSSLTCSSTCVSLPVKEIHCPTIQVSAKHRPSTLVPLQMSIAPFAPVNLIGGQSSNKIIYNTHGILMNIVIVHLDYYTSHLQHGSHQTYWPSLLIWIQVLIAFDLSHPTLLEVTPPMAQRVKDTPREKGSRPMETPTTGTAPCKHCSLAAKFD